MSGANLWRWSYAQPPDVETIGVAAAKLIRPGSRMSRAEQAEAIRRTGFVANADLGRDVAAVLLEKGWHRTGATYAGHVAAAGRYSWQGNRRIAEIMHISQRTAQRWRAALEEAGLLRTYLLLTGDMVEGQRRPVVRPQVIRDGSELRRLVAGRGGPLRQPQERSRPAPRPSAADVPSAGENGSHRLSAADLEELQARVAPEFAHFFTPSAALKQREEPPPVPAPPGCPPSIDAAEIDEWDRVTLEMEREYLSRGPPGRGPPPPDAS